VAAAKPEPIPDEALFVLPLELGLACVQFIANHPWTVNHELMDALKPFIAPYFAELQAPEPL
jgi:hypothetical protein